jgi:hypothetical protein
MEAKAFSFTHRTKVFAGGTVWKNSANLCVRIYASDGSGTFRKYQSGLTQGFVVPAKSHFRQVPVSAGTWAGNLLIIPFSRSLFGNSHKFRVLVEPEIYQECMGIKIPRARNPTPSPTARYRTYHARFHQKAPQKQNSEAIQKLPANTTMSRCVIDASLVPVLSLV